jgi:hypothetical protein
MRPTCGRRSSVSRALNVPRRACRYPRAAAHRDVAVTSAFAEALQAALATAAIVKVAERVSTNQAAPASVAQAAAPRATFAAATTRHCNGCNRTQPVDAFPMRGKSRPGKRTSRCRECKAKADAIWRAAHPSYSAEWKARNPDRVAASLRRQADRVFNSIPKEPIP